MKRLRVAADSIVYIVWVDSAACKGWTPFDQIDPDPALIRSAGIVVINSPTGLTITASRGHDKAESPITIPWGCIQKLTVMRKL